MGARESEVSRHHSIDYIEFKVTDLEEAKRFYGAAFGWTFTDYGPGYAGIRRVEGEGEAGGFALVDAVSPGGVLPVLRSERLEETLTAVAASGGRIVEAIFSFPGGRRFEFLDPSGNRIAVWSDPE